MASISQSLGSCNSAVIPHEGPDFIGKTMSISLFKEKGIANEECLDYMFFIDSQDYIESK